MRRIPFGYFTLDSFYSLFDRIIALLLKFQADDADFKTFISKAQTLLERLEKAMITSTANHTQKVRTNDHLFNNAFLAFKHYLKVMHYSDVEAEHNAADLLIKLVTKHGWQLQTFSLSKQNSRAKNLLGELKEGEYLQAQQTINLVAYTQKLDQKLNDLENSILERSKFVAELPDSNTDEVTKELQDIISKIMIYIEAKCLLSSTGEWKELKDTIEITIDSAIQSAKISRAKKPSPSDEVNTEVLNN